MVYRDHIADIIRMLATYRSCIAWHQMFVSTRIHLLAQKALAVHSCSRIIMNGARALYERDLIHSYIAVLQHHVRICSSEERGAQSLELAGPSLFFEVM